MTALDAPDPGEATRLLNPRRSAHATIRGYLYQTCLGVLRWLELKPNEILLCEGDEDLDRFLLGGEAVSEQVKAYTGGLSLSDRAVVESLGNFLRSYVALRRDYGETRKFVFTTTASQKGTRRPGLNFDLLEAWKAGIRTPEAIAAVRSLLEPRGDDKNREETTPAIAWLDAEPQGWEGFMDAVEWSFGTPDLDEIRNQVKDRLAVHVDTRDLPAEIFIDRLVTHVLRASSQPKPENRTLNATSLSDLIETARTDLGNWVRTPAAERIHTVFDELKQVQGLLYDNTKSLPEKASPGRLLTAAYEVIPFDEAGRREELDFLTGWCDSDDRLSVLLLTGEGGSGKTRLMIEWCRHLRHLGWHAGFFRPDRKAEDLDPLLEGAAPRFVVIDYAENRLGVVEPLLLKMGLQAEGQGPKLRLVLLARRQADWWENLSRTGHQIGDLLLRSPEPRAITPLLPQDTAERERAFHVAVGGFSVQLGLEIPQDLYVPDLSRNEFEIALYLHMAALAALQGERIETASDALKQTLEHERRFWCGHVSDLGLDRSSASLLNRSVEPAVAALALIGGANDYRHATALLSRTLKDFHLQPHHQTTLVEFFRDLYAGTRGEGLYIDPLQPDLLAEELVTEALARDEKILTSVLNGCTAAEGHSVLTLLTRLAQNRPHLEHWIRIALQGRLDHLGEVALHVGFETGDPIGIELAKEIEHNGTADLCIRLLHVFESDLRRSIPLRESAFIVTKIALDFYRSSWSKPTEEQEVEISRLTNNLVAILNDLERNEEALEACKEAVRLRRMRADRHPNPESLQYLATSLINLGELLYTTRQHEEALRATAEAVNIQKMLAQDGEHSTLATLALATSNLATKFANLGQLEKALHANEESLNMYSSIQGELSADHQVSFIRALRNRGNYLSGLGRLDEALAIAKYAVTIGGQFATHRPDIFLPDLSSTLNNLGNRLSDMGDNERAAQILEESVDILRSLAARRPSSFLPALGVRLSNLSICLNETHRYEAALHASKESTDIFRQLAKRVPLEFQHKLAGSLINLGASYDNASQPQKALDSYYESAHLHRQLAAEQPAIFLRPLALVLSNLGNLLRRLRKLDEAFRILDEAVRIAKQIAKAEKEFEPNLAQNIYNLSLVLRDLGKLRSAFEAVREARDILAPFYTRFPSAFQKPMAAILDFYNKLAKS